MAAPDKAQFMKDALGSVDDTRSSLALMDAMTLLKSNKSNASDVAKAIKFDPRISDHIITEVNSPFYGLRNRVENLEQAIALLGFKRIRELLATSSTHDMYKKVENSYFELVAFKKHGAAVACIAEQMAVALRIDKTDEFFQAGMMHDIGKYLYMTKVGDQFIRLINRSKKENIPLFQLEKETFGVNHSDLGEVMAEAWGLGDGIRAAIKYHHEINEKQRDRLTTRELQIVDLVTYANLLSHGSMVNGESTGTRAAIDALPPPPANLSKEEIRKILDIAESHYSEVCNQLGLE